MFVSLLFFIVPFIYCDKNIKFAAVIYRHGDRTPVESYPNDPWRNESLWPVKFGELTNLGKQQHYALGKWLRKRYDHLLSDKFDPSEIYVRSTDIDRTLMSAQANLAGMYPPKGNTVWNDNLAWQPIPVHTVPEHEDEVLAMKKNCPAYNKEHLWYRRSKEYKQRLNKYKNLMEYLTVCTGKTINDYEGIIDIYSTLCIEKLYNFTLPKWTENVYPEKMDEPAAYSFKVDTATPILARLKVGPLVKSVISKLNDFYTNSKHKYKVVIYSGHDYTIGNFLNGLGLYNDICPPYTSTILIELVGDDKTSSHSVRISYRNSTQIVEPHVLSIPNCGELCPVERFMELYKNFTAFNWEKECNAEILHTSSHFFSVAFFLGIGIIVLVYTVHKIHFARVAARYRHTSKVYSGVGDVPIKSSVPLYEA